MAAVVAAAASSAASKVASTVATALVSAARNWTKGHFEETIEELVSQNNEVSDDQKTTTLDEEAVSKSNVILKALTKDLEDIKASIDVLRNKDYNKAKVQFIEALRWPDKPEHFKNRIESTFDLCDGALGTVSSSADKIQVYALRIASGFIFHSNYGQDLLSGLRHIHNVLRDMNHDKKLRKDLSSALGSKVYWSAEQKELIRSVVLFSAQICAFIREVQQSIDELDALKNDVRLQNVNGFLISSKNEDEKRDEDHPVKSVLEEELNGSVSVITHQQLMHRNWLPMYWTGFYFGDIGGVHGNGGCKYSIIDEKHLRNLIGFSKHQMLIPKDGDAHISNFDVWCRVSVPPHRNHQDMKHVINPNTEIVEQKVGRHTEDTELLLSCSVAFDSKIKDLRRMISEHPENCMMKFKKEKHSVFCLFSNGDWLEDDKSISEYRVLPGDHLDFILEQKMEMEYHRGRGYNGICSPHRLLDGNENTFYWSESTLPINGDWMIFKRKNNATFNIKHVMIRNWGHCGSAIKSIVISTSSEDDQYIKWMEIKNIKQGNEERQWFAVKKKTGKEVKHKINFIRIDILENYGWKGWNKFREFAIYGISE